MHSGGRGFRTRVVRDDRIRTAVELGESFAIKLVHAFRGLGEMNDLVYFGDKLWVNRGGGGGLLSGSGMVGRGGCQSEWSEE